MFYPNYEQYKENIKHSKIIPISYEITTAISTPIEVFQKMQTTEYCFLFESVEGDEHLARYSFIGRRPLIVLKSLNGNTTVSIKDTIYQYEGSPISVIQQLMEQFKSSSLPHLPRLCSGLTGYFGYDCIQYFEKIACANEDELGIEDCHLMVPEEVIVFDHTQNKVHIVINTIPELEQNTYTAAIKKIEHLATEIINSDTFNHTMKQIKQNSPLEFVSNTSYESYCKSVEKIKDYIKNGDAFQVVLSQRFSAQYDGHPLAVYSELRNINPSPYMYFIKFDECSVVGASPEMLVRVENGKVETCPIAGTRPRGKDIESEKEIINDLIHDEKEVAEHTMLVDLGRNDIGRVCKFGSVKVKNLMHIEKYSHVMHMVTNVEGEIREDVSALDALKAVFPAGTVSGAPKVRAMEIIEELETLKRGVYAGAIGYISLDGNMDVCIAIRTAVFKNNRIYIQAGGGIVADSVPENEYMESVNKAGALMDAAKRARCVQ